MANNLKLSITVFIVFLLIGDLSIRYIFKMHLTRKEIFSGYYSSDYKRNKIKAVSNRVSHVHIPWWYHINKPNTSKVSTQPEFHYLYKYNSLGLTDADTSASDPQKDWIITIGDSFTEGIGAPMDSSWPRLLDNIIHQDSTFENYRIVNAGKAGSDIYFEYMLLKKLNAYYHPKIVILNINTTDIEDIIIRGSGNRFNADSTVQFNNAPWWEPIYACSYIARSIINNTIKPDYTLTPEKSQSFVQQNAIDSMYQCVQDFKKLSVQQKFKLIISINPAIAEIGTTPTHYESLVNKLEADTSYAFINLKHEYITQKAITPENYSIYYWAQDGHNNSEGYKIWAKIVAPFLIYELKDER